VINAIIRCLTDSNKVVVSGILDFVNAQIPLGAGLVPRSAQVVLLEAMLGWLAKKNTSISRKIYIWLFGKPNQQNEYVIGAENRFAVGYLVVACKKLFATAPENAEQAVAPLDTLQALYGQHQQLVAITLVELSFIVLEYVFRHHRGYSFSELVLSAGRKFIETLSEYFQIDQLMMALSKQIQESLRLDRFGDVKQVLS